ncbi:atrial natriuretic peptide receptor 1-like [Paramacrobiotus metropolitanus]|uniref:atrial natriuretic peptide receptor 1-like n=1 Tax=Paramacrobiotus metropolitanus TaxID=2943436 RepID=UPI0024464005|nr:atrial natriuretic peptide receptor 1-like [Paramacrobiotus metropolitanus]
MPPYYALPVNLLIVIFLPEKFALVYSARPLRVNIGSVGFFQNALAGAFPNTGPPYDMALDDVRDLYGDTLQFNHTYISKWSIKNCDPELVENAEDLMADYYYKTQDEADLTVFISPGCNEIEATSKLAAQWNVLQISTTSDNGFIANRQQNPVWISLATGSFTNVVKAYMQLLLDYNWTNVFIVWETTSNPIFRGSSEVISKALRDRPQMQPVYRSMNAQNGTKEQLISLLEEFRRTSRVLLFFGHSNHLRKLLIAAYRLNMTTSEFVYIGLQPLFHSASIGNFSWRFNDSLDPIAREAYKNVLLLGAEHLDNQTEVDQMDPIMREWRRQSFLKWNLTYVEPSPYLRPAYASIVMLAQVLNETFSANSQFNFRNGTALADLFLNREFETKVMRAAIGEYGNILVNLSLRFTDPETQELRIVLQWDGVKQRYIKVANFSWPNGPPRNRPICGYTGNDPVCASSESKSVVIGATMGALLALFSLIAGLMMIDTRMRKMKTALNDRTWVIDERDLVAGNEANTTATLPHRESACYSVMLTLKGKYKRKWHGMEVWTDALHASPIGSQAAHNLLYETNPTFQLTIREIKECAHPNINRLLGLYAARGIREHCFIRAVTTWSARGSIGDVIDSRRELDWIFCASFIQNLLNAVQFIHSSAISYHGSLSTRKCLLDQHFTLKLSGFGYHAVAKHVEHPEQTWNLPSPPTALSRPWSKIGTVETAQMDDMSSVGKIMLEILHWQHSDDWLDNSAYDMHPKGVLSKETDTHIRRNTALETLPATVSIEDLANSCLNIDFTLRPSALSACMEVEEILGEMKDFSGNVVDKILRRLGTYSEKLEAEVSAKTAQLIHEREKSERLLVQLLPRDLVENLRKGEHVMAEEYESTTVFFSDVMGFDEIVVKCMPIASLEILTHIFKTLDTAIAGFDVYKVETIGDHYMVASGLPVRNGQQHAREICLMASKMLELFRRSTTLRTLSLWLRGGLHSGTCAAGVVGLNRPRYCLFGDTVNVAARMCSSSESDKVQLSLVTSQILTENFPDVGFQSRGMVFVKGRGEMQTFWLQQEE